MKCQISLSLKTVHRIIKLIFLHKNFRWLKFQGERKNKNANTRHIDNIVHSLALQQWHRQFKCQQTNKVLFWYQISRALPLHRYTIYLATQIIYKSLVVATLTRGREKLAKVHVFVLPHGFSNFSSSIRSDILSCTLFLVFFVFYWMPFMFLCCEETFQWWKLKQSDSPDTDSYFHHIWKQKE